MKKTSVNPNKRPNALDQMCSTPKIIRLSTLDSKRRQEWNSVFKSSITLFSNSNLFYPACTAFLIRYGHNFINSYSPRPMGSDVQGALEKAVEIYVLSSFH